MSEQAKHTPGPVAYSCKRCGWMGDVNGRPRCLPCYARRTAQWRLDNPEKKRELKRRADKKLRAERPEVAAARKRARRARNPDQCRAKWAERAAWLRSGDVTREQLRAICNATDGKCSYCGVRVAGVRVNPTDPRGFDHVVPRSKGGRHTADNLVLCCGSCNERRSDRG
jgi:5-methylcytosine-specific restriction endonuclease McrA